MLHKKGFRDTAIFLIAIFFVLSLISIIFKLENYTFFALGFGGCVASVFLLVEYKIFDYFEISILTIIGCIIGLLLNHILMVEEFIYAGIIVADIAFFKIYNKWALHEINKENNEAIDFFKQNPDAEVYEHESGQILNPNRFNNCKSPAEINAMLEKERQERRK